jgi:SPASM domain peptide maturase of grasp-with-spasm system
MNTSRYFVLHSNCIPVRGIARSIICDLQMSTYYFIPNDLCELLESSKVCCYEVEMVIQNHGQDNKSTIQEYFNFLFERELGYWTNSDLGGSWPKMDMSFHNPSVITHAIVEVDKQITHHKFNKNTVEQLENLLCKSVQLQFLNQSTKIADIKEILEYFNDTVFREIELLLPFSKLMPRTDLYSLFEKYSRLKSVLFYEATIDDMPESTKWRINYTNEPLENYVNFMPKAQNLFLTVQHFVESQSRNTYYSQKVFINASGEVYNTPQSSVSFGHVSKLREIVTSTEFQRLWFVTKDQIKECQICEFRRMCYDGRPLLFDEAAQEYSASIPCSYSAERMEWVIPNLV